MAGGWIRAWPRRAACGAALLLTSLLLLAACGDDEFDYKISGDRMQGETRAGTGEFSGASTASHDDLMRIQQEYQEKIQTQGGG